MKHKSQTPSNFKATWVVLLTLLLGACRLGPPEVPLLASARIAGDFGTYQLARIGLVPAIYTAGIDSDTNEQRAALDSSLLGEFSASMAQELVALTDDDFDEIPTSEPLRLGTYEPQTLIRIARRYRLDALMFVHVTQRRPFPPQQLAMTAELVAADTGLVIWTASVNLDAGHERVRDALRAFYFNTKKDLGTGGDWRLALLSPSRFATFGSWQLARML